MLLLWFAQILNTYQNQYHGVENRNYFLKTFKQNVIQCMLKAAGKRAAGKRATAKRVTVKKVTEKKRYRQKSDC